MRSLGRCAQTDAIGTLPITKKGVRAFAPAFKKLRRCSIEPFAASLAGGLFLVSAVTFAAFKLHFNLAAAGFLQLLVVLFLALRAGFLSATIVSVAANLSLNFFFIPPLFTFTIADPQNWVALFAFEFAALLVSHLSNTAKRQAELAVHHRSDSERLYEVSRQILMTVEQEHPACLILQTIRSVFALQAAVLFDGPAAETIAVGQPSSELNAQTRAAYLNQQDYGSKGGATWIRSLRTGVRTVGALGLQGPALHPTVVNALASLTSIALERARSFARENRAEAERQAERLRTAVLDALAHEYKSPLTSIGTAAGGLLATDELAPRHAALAQLIEQQTARLNLLTTRLLQMARLDSADVKLRHDCIHLNDLLEIALSSARRELAGHIVNLDPAPPPVTFIGDRELLVIALTQFLDNAAKYSDPCSVITVACSATSSEIQIGVNNPGVPIPPQDRERIFGRFYRAAGTGHAVAGTGLGLSIAKKVADTHQGRVWVSCDVARGNTFFLALPLRTL